MGEEDGETGGENTKEKPINLYLRGSSSVVQSIQVLFKMSVIAEWWMVREHVA